MHPAARLLTLTLALLPLAPSGAGADLPAIRFAAPAQAGGDLAAGGASWALVVTSGGMEAGLLLEDAAALLAQEHEVMTLGEHQTPRSGYQGWRKETDGLERSPLPPTVALSTQAAGPTSFYVEGRDLRLAVDGVQATIDLPPGQCLGVLTSPEDNQNETTRSSKLCPAAWPAVVARPAAGSSLRFRLEGEGVQRAHWHNMATRCEGGGECPPGGAQETQTVWLSSTDYVRTRRHVFEDASGPPTAQALGAGEASLVVFGGTRFDLAIDGWARLPLASAMPGCGSCLAPQNQTLSAGGEFTLRSLEASPDGGLQSALVGDLASARLDEQAIDSRLLGSAAVAAAAAGAGALLLKALLGTLFTRHRDEEILKSDRRRLLYEFIASHPGAHFREALRGAGIPSGSGRHHLTQLVRAGLAEERRVGSKLLLFASNQRLPDGWQDAASLRNPRLRLLHEWVGANPERSQKDILAAFAAAHGWNPSTTQGRLARLERAGLLRARAQGRYKHYAVAPGAAGGQGDAGPMPLVELRQALAPRVAAPAMQTTL